MPTVAPTAPITYAPGTKMPTGGAPNGYVTVGANGQMPTPSTGSSPVMPPTSDTVLSNANIIENTIPQLNQKASSLAIDEPTMLASSNPVTIPTTPTTTPVTPTGTPPAGWDASTYAAFKAANPGLEPTPEDTQNMLAAGSTDYGTLYDKALSDQGDPTQDPTYQSDVALINSLQDTNDATTSAYVNSIQQNYAALTDTLKQQQAASTAKVGNALLLGGSSRYAPISTGGILDLKTRSDMNALATLQDQENQKIAEVKQAQSTQDYNLMSKKMSELDTITAAKQKTAASIATAMQKANTTAQTAQVQNQQDNAIADLVSSGTTDPDDILAALTKQGFTTATSKSVTTTLEGIQKATGTKSLTALSGNIGAFYSLKAAGELPDDIASLPDNQQLFAFLKADKAASTAPKTTKTTSSGTGGKTITSGTLTYTPADFASDSAALNKSKGADHFVDPSVYLNLYNAWVAPSAGGSITDFLKTFPPKDYVNPANTTLPTYLQSGGKKTTSTASTSADPFG